MTDAPNGPFYVMIDYKKSAAECESLEEARAVGQGLCDAEPLPCSFSIADADGEHVEDIARTDQRSLADQMGDFNALQQAARGSQP